MRRHQDKPDNNQDKIIKDLRKIPGITVEPGHHDILVGCIDKNGARRTYWYEIKNPDIVNKKGEVKPSAIKPSQQKLIKKWTGHYKIVSNLNEILKDIGII